MNLNRLLQLIWGTIEADDSRSKWRQFLGLSVLLGLVAVVVRDGLTNWAAISASALLAGASLIVGVVVGFLFGIPKTVQRKIDPGDVVATTSEVDYRANTNLEEISDWLTKMLVGVGLVELREVPHFIDKVAAYWAPTLGTSKPYAAGVLIYFSATGFLIGYLWTRLALVGDFIEKDPRRLISQLLSRVAQHAQRNPDATDRSPTRQVVTAEDLDAAQALAKLAAESRVGLDELRKQVRSLAAQYETVRASMPSGPERTRRMEVIATQMRTFSVVAYPLLSEFVNSDSSGERLAAITFLQSRSDSSYLKWLADRVVEEKPFVGYHAAVALQHAARDASGWLRQQVREAIDSALERMRMKEVSPSTDRILVLRHAMELTRESDAEGT